MAHAFRSTRVLTTQGLRAAALIVDGERIASVRAWDDVAEAKRVDDFGDLLLLPGLVDSHVHINDPGRDWEGFETASQAACSGGVTTLVDMPLNNVPETVDAETLMRKRSAAQGKTWVDWAAWGGVVKGNQDQLAGLINAGVPGFKCFLIHSGIDGFAWVDEADLRSAMERLRERGLPLLAHAELAGPIDAATATLNRDRADWRKFSTYLASRPDIAEIDAIQLLTRLAEEYRAPVHVVHLSSAEALPLLAEARRRGAPVTVETCVHYLWFASEEISDGATEYKCAPPIRSRANREKLWMALESGQIDLIATDHSPCTPNMKHRSEGRFDLAWGGIASLGLALPLLWTVLEQRGFDAARSAERIGKWMAAGPARLAGMLGRKGLLAAGADADLTVFDPDTTWIVSPDSLHFRHRLSPYLGARLRGRVQQTWLRGKRIFLDGRFSDTPMGREVVHG